MIEEPHSDPAPMPTADPTPPAPEPLTAPALQTDSYLVVTVVKGSEPPSVRDGAVNLEEK